VFMLPIHQPGIEMHRIEMLNGSRDFCQEFLTDVRMPDGDRIGRVDEGWTVGIRWMVHERMLFNSPLVTVPAGTTVGSGGATSMLALARQAGRLDDPAALDLAGEARMREVVGRELRRRLREGMATATMPDQASAIGRLYDGLTGARRMTIAFEIAGPTAIAWCDDDGELAECGTDFLMRQAGCIGGGTVEMARNVISERVLGMPRERTLDRDIPFSQVRRSPSHSTAPRSR
jgi:alkylation response protein AidB-like acyl-CoA dehydrogenase